MLKECLRRRCDCGGRLEARLRMKNRLETRCVECGRVIVFKSYTQEA